MKKLFALLFSFQLIVTPVFAQNAPGTEEDAYLTSGAGDKKKNGGYDFYVSQIGALATSAVGTSIITSCTTAFKNPSLMILFAGSLAHIASELLGAKASNEDHKKRLKDLKIKESELTTKGGSAQKEVLEQRLAEEKATLKFLKNRTIWMTAVSVIYGAALTTAIFESIVHYIPSYGPVPNALYQFFTGTCSGGKDGKGIPWGTVISAAYGMGTSKLGNGGAISTYGTMLITLLNFAVPTLSKSVVSLFDQPISRVIVIGAFMALAATVTSGLIVRTGIAKKNIEKLEKAIAQFKADTDGQGSGISTDTPLPGTDDNIEDTINTKKSITPLAETKKKQCVSLAGGVADISEAACPKKVVFTKTNLPQGFNLPGVSQVNNLTTDMANALASGDEAGAAALAGDIGAYAARVKSETDLLKKQYNDTQKKNNKPQMDFDKSIKEQVASLQSTINDSAKAGNIDLAAAAAGANKLDEDSALKDETPVVTTAAPSPVTDIPVDPLAGMGGTEEMILPESKTVAAAQSLDDFESTEQDIAKTPETSIFKQLSNRYILNYTKMFETKKSIQPEKASPTN